MSTAIKSVLTFESAEQVTDFLKTDEEGKRILTEITNGEYVKQADLGGLVQNKDKILEEKREMQKKYKEATDENTTLKAQIEELEKKLDVVDESEYTRLVEAEKVWLETKSKAKDGNTSDEINTLQTKINNIETTAKKKAESLEKIILDKNNEINSLTNSINNFTIEQGLIEQMNLAMIAEEHRPLMLDAFRGRASIELDDMGTRQVVMQDKISKGLLPITDFFTGWTNDDNNKRYIKAPNTTGGGSGTNGKAFGNVNINDLLNQVAEATSKGNTKEAILLEKQIFNMNQHANGRTS